MKNLPTYEAFVNEMEIPSNKWIDWDLSRLDKEGEDLIWKMYSDTYGKAGVHYPSDIEAGKAIGIALAKIV